jgi:hypothetical protein
MSWFGKNKNEVERTDMGYIWDKGQGNDRNIWRMISRCIDKEKRNM